MQTTNVSVQSPRRLVICVDGTWCTPDGASLTPRVGTLTNIYHIYASVLDSKHTGRLSHDGFFQEVVYEAGIGSAEPASIRRLFAGAFGDGFQKQIRTVYERCCTLQPEDEIWLFGFSRGAFVVRAVAGLLHFLRSLTSAGTPDFIGDYEKALKYYKMMQTQGESRRGAIHSHLSTATRNAAKIKFIGVFDTVKAVDDDNLYDITLNDSILNLRHALAIHEDRQVMTPEYIWPDASIRLSERDRTFVQAWFIGRHIDMGGSSPKAGLSLYPLQWILIEAEALGLHLEFAGTFDRRAAIDNALELCFPKTEEQGKGVGAWTCKTQSGVTTTMHDIRKVHTLPCYEGRYELKINKARSSLWSKRSRQIFSDTDDKVNGFSDYNQGTIIHPSVFQLLDESISINLDSDAPELQDQLDTYRNSMIDGCDARQIFGFWNDTAPQEMEDLGAVRVLVCGNAGVGKSTLVNRVFGVDVTTTAHRLSGEHNVDREIRVDDRPDLIIHDSRGFEAGAADEMEVVRSFLREKSTASNLDDRLHVIWFCIEANSVRTMQRSTRDMFQCISIYAKEIPIIVAVTKADEFCAIKSHEHREQLEAQGQEPSFRECDEYSREALQSRVALIRSEMLKVDDGRLDDCVAVSRKWSRSIDELSRTTSECISSERVRIMYVRSQATLIDLKIKMAVEETMKVYKTAIRNAAVLGSAPLAGTTTHTSAAVDICRKILTAFGAPSISTDLIMTILLENVTDGLNNNTLLAISKGIATMGVLSSIATVGMPLFLISGVVNVPMIVPATARLILMLAADVILMLARSFHEARIMKNISQPAERDLKQAACIYRTIAGEVHRKIKKLMPRKRPAIFVRYGHVKAGFMAIVTEYYTRMLDDQFPSAGNYHEDVGEHDNDVESDATMVEDVLRYAEDPTRTIAELDTGTESEGSSISSTF